MGRIGGGWRGGHVESLQQCCGQLDGLKRQDHEDLSSTCPALYCTPLPSAAVWPGLLQLSQLGFGGVAQAGLVWWRGTKKSQQQFDS